MFPKEYIFFRALKRKVIDLFLIIIVGVKMYSIKEATEKHSKDIADFQIKMAMET